MPLVKRYILLVSILFFVKGWAQEEKSFFTHTVQAGETLYSIANMYKTSTAEIIKLNPSNITTIYSGQTLHIPQNKDTTEYIYHTIKAGETLYKLTVTYKISPQEICEANPGLSAENFKTDEVIRIPTKKITNPNNRTTILKKETQPIICKETYTIKKKETIYKICKKFHITEDELLLANPNLKNTGLEKGDKLCIPYSHKHEALKAPSNTELFKDCYSSVEPMKTIKIAIMLPFSKDSRMTEYYEGFLIAVDSLKHCGVSMDIYAYDTKGDINTLLNEKKELSGMNVIIGPLYKNQIKPLAIFAKNHKIRLVIPFTSKSDEILENPYVYQVNTPQTYLYPIVYNHFLKLFGSRTNVIFIEDKNKDNSKEDFVKGLKDVLIHNAIPYSTLEDNASMETMGNALFPEHNNIFIPTSSSGIVLHKILPKIQMLIRNSSNLNIRLFGYPEWQTLTNEFIKGFFEANTYFYTSFFTNNIFQTSKQFEKDYWKWYHKSMENRYPKYGMLGFDTGYYFMKGLATYGADLEKQVNKIHVIPVQTGFLFKRINNWSGFINQKVFYIHYTPKSEVVKIDFD